MQISVDIPFEKLLNLISNLNINELEEVKNKIVERELYFQKFKKDNIENIVEDFKKEGYSNDFLSDLENGLKKSSVYAD